MFGFLRRGASDEERVDLQGFLRDSRSLVEAIDREFKSWMEVATADQRTLAMENDPDGQHAAVYLWRVGDPARDFVQLEPVKAAQRYYEAYALCLEARGSAADMVKEAADRAAILDPAPKIAEANKKLAEAERERNRANEALRELESRLGR